MVAYYLYFKAIKTPMVITIILFSGKTFYKKPNLPHFFLHPITKLTPKFSNWFCEKNIVDIILILTGYDSLLNVMFNCIFHFVCIDISDE
jgi:hypothetical protein